MGEERGRGRTAILLAGVLLIACSGYAAAQSANAPGKAGQPGSGINGQVVGAGSGSSQGEPHNDKIDSSNGVAGTGMGSVPGGNKAGTGQSVKGPAGQGITNSTDKMQ